MRLRFLAPLLTTLLASSSLFAQTAQPTTSPLHFYVRTGVGMVFMPLNHSSSFNPGDGYGNYTFKTKHTSSDLLFSAEFGYRQPLHIKEFSDLRFGLEFSNSQSTAKGDIINENGNGTFQYRVRSQRWMLNSTLDFKQLWKTVTPYVMFGLGSATNTLAHFIDDEQASGLGTFATKHKQRLAFQVGFGGSINIDKSLSASLGYRYVDAGKLQSGPFTNEPGTKLSQELTSSELLASLNYLF